MNKIKHLKKVHKGKKFFSYNGREEIPCKIEDAIKSFLIASKVYKWDKR